MSLKRKLSMRAGRVYLLERKPRFTELHIRVANEEREL
jgi:hypothetical protein